MLLTDVPAENMRLHLCLRADDGIIIVDTCASRDAFERFVAGVCWGHRSHTGRAQLAPHRREKQKQTPR